MRITVIMEATTEAITGEAINKERNAECVSAGLSQRQADCHGSAYVL